MDVVIFASQFSQKFPLQYMPIYNNENIPKIKLSRIFPPSPNLQKYLYPKYM